MTRRTACGMTTNRSAWRVREAERARCSRLARVHRVDAGAVHLGHVRRVDEHERDDPPEQRIDRHPGQRERRDTEAEDVDHEDRGDAAEEVDVDDRHRPDRKEDRTGKAAQDRHCQREDEDEDLRDQEDLHVDPEGPEDVRECALELLRAEEGLLDVVPAGRVDHQDDDDRAEECSRDEGDGDAPAATALRQAAEDPRVAVLFQWSATSGPAHRPAPDTSSGDPSSFRSPTDG